MISSDFVNIKGIVNHKNLFSRVPLRWAGCVRALKIEHQNHIATVPQYYPKPRKQEHQNFYN